MFARLMYSSRNEELNSTAMAEENDPPELTTEEKIERAPRVFIGKAELRFDPDDQDEFFQEVARTQLRETPEIRDEAFKKIRELVQGDPNMTVIDTDEYYQMFLRPCKWYPESAFNLMKRFYMFQKNYPHVSKNLLPSNEKSVLSSGVLIPLPIRTHDGCRLLLIEGGKRWKPKEISLDQMFKGVMLILTAAMAEPKTQIAGARVILNMEGLSLSHVTHFTPSFAAMTVEWIQRCLPCRLKGIHVVNQPFIFNMVFSIFKPFLQDKVRKRIHFHGTDRASLFNEIEPNVLPTRIGGELELPESGPSGDLIWQYFCAFEEDFRGILRYYSTSLNCFLQARLRIYLNFILILYLRTHADTLIKRNWRHERYTAVLDSITTVMMSPCHLRVSIELAVRTCRVNRIQAKHGKDG